MHGYFKEFKADDPAVYGTYLEVRVARQEDAVLVSVKPVVMLEGGKSERPMADAEISRHPALYQKWKNIDAVLRNNGFSIAEKPEIAVIHGADPGDPAYLLQSQTPYAIPKGMHPERAERAVGKALTDRLRFHPVPVRRNSDIGADETVRER